MVMYKIDRRGGGPKNRILGQTPLTKISKIALGHYSWDKIKQKSIYIMLINNSIIQFNNPDITCR